MQAAQGNSKILPDFLTAPFGARTQRKRQNPQIEALRGIAALLVLFYHIFDRYFERFCGFTVPFVHYWGKLGVGIFLVISGYYYVDFSKAPADRDFSWRSYVLRRLGRVWPCYAVSVTLTFLITHLLHDAELAGSIGDYFLNLSFLNGFLDTPYIDGSHWYLTTYLSLTLVTACGRKWKAERSPYFYIAWAAALAVFRMSSLRPLVLLSRLLGNSYIGYFLVPVALNRLRYAHSFRKGEALQTMLWILILLGGLVLIDLAVGAYAVAEMLLILPLVYGCAAGKLPRLESRPLLFFGTISYPLYLVHQYISYAVMRRLTLASGGYQIWYAAAAIALSIILAIALHITNWHFDRAVSGRNKTV